MDLITRKEMAVKGRRKERSSHGQPANLMGKGHMRTEKGALGLPPPLAKVIRKKYVGIFIINF